MLNDLPSESSKSSTRHEDPDVRAAGGSELYRKDGVQEICARLIGAHVLKMSAKGRQHGYIGSAPLSSALHQYISDPQSSAAWRTYGLAPISSELAKSAAETLPMVVNFERDVTRAGHTS